MAAASDGRLKAPDSAVWRRFIPGIPLIASRLARRDSPIVRAGHRNNRSSRGALKETLQQHDKLAARPRRTVVAQARARHRWRRVSREGSGGGASCQRRWRDHHPASARIRPAGRPGHSATPRRDLTPSKRSAGPRRSHRPSGGARRRHRRQPRASRRVLLRQPDDGRAAPARGLAGRRGQVRRHWHRVRVSEVHARALPRGRHLGRVSGGDQRALRPRQEDAARAVAGLPRSVRLQLDLPVAGKPLRSLGQLRSRLVSRDPGPDPQVLRSRRIGGARDRRAGATAAPHASSSISTMRRRGLCWRRNAWTRACR